MVLGVYRGGRQRIQHYGVQGQIFLRRGGAEASYLEGLSKGKILVNIVLRHSRASVRYNLVIGFVGNFYVGSILVCCVVDFPEGKGKWSQGNHGILVAHYRSLVNLVRQKCLHGVNE